jgi:hypothetical protein
MKRPAKARWLGSVGLALALACTIGNTAAADARTEQLVDMLDNGGNYRVRVQAATTLGKIRARDAIPALVRALNDDSELVVISVATALLQVGDPTVIRDLEAASRRAASEAARSQIAAAIRTLKAFTPEGDTAAAEAAPPSLLIRVDVMGNSSGVPRDDLPGVMQEIVAARLRREPGVVLQDSGMKPAAVKKKLAGEKLRGFILSGSIIRLERVDDRLVVRISLNVFTNPDYNLLLMPSAEGAIPLPGGPLTPEAELAAQDRAVKAVVEALLESVVKKLRGPDV